MIFVLTTRDIQSIFSYIKQLHQHCPADKLPRLTQTVADAWSRGLAGYTVEEVYKAADAHARSCRYWPSLAEIVKQLPQRTAVHDGLDGELRWRQARWCRTYRESLREELERLGLREFDGNTGEEYRVWQTTCEAAGVDFGALLAAAHNAAYAGT